MGILLKFKIDENNFVEPANDCGTQLLLEKVFFLSKILKLSLFGQKIAVFKGKVKSRIPGAEKNPGYPVSRISHSRTPQIPVK